MILYLTQQYAKLSLRIVIARHHSSKLPAQRTRIYPETDDLHSQELRRREMNEADDKCLYVVCSSNVVCPTE